MNLSASNAGLRIMLECVGKHVYVVNENSK